MRGFIGILPGTARSTDAMVTESTSARLLRLVPILFADTAGLLLWAVNERGLAELAPLAT